MKRRKTLPGRESERGVVILVVAVVLLFIVVAMAALAIDLTTFYTARSEAQIAADGAALAGARVLANSGTTSNPSDPDLWSNAKTLAITIATQVAQNNRIGGGNPTDVSVFPNPGSTGYNPQISVRVTRSDLPTFFARIWGRTQVTVTASATAEAYNPSGASGGEEEGRPPVAPICVKPWLLPNLYVSGTPIFDPVTGAILAPAGFLGQSVPIPSTSTTGGLYATCGNGVTGCSSLPPASAWQYFPGKASSFPTPTQALPACSAGFNDPLVGDYQKSIAGCVQRPIQCGQNVDLDTGFNDPSGFPDLTAATAVNCLTHSQLSNGDSMVPYVLSQPFKFLAGVDNPVVKPAGSTVIVSDSLVTVPVVNVSAQFDNPTVKVIGFVQLFLNPNGTAAPGNALPGTGLPAIIVNLVGCRSDASVQAILGNGPSAVPVRLITPTP